MRESGILHDIRLALGQRDDCVVWRNHTGVIVDTPTTCPRCKHHFVARLQRPQRFGLCVGSSDLIGIRNDGKFIAVEAKGPKGRATEEQVHFVELVRRQGGLSGFARSVEQAERIVEE